MRVEFYGLTLETPRVTFYLWTPWRATALEHRLFEVVSELPGAKREQAPDCLMMHIGDAKTWRGAVQAVERVLKGWQEEADPGGERRGWRWLFEGDTDAYGYDHAGEPASLWLFLRATLDQGVVGESQKGEDVELNDFGARVWPAGRGA